MINAESNYDAVVCCDCCLKELGRGRYPFDAEENVSSECFIISGDGERPNEHYCNECYQLQIQEEEFIKRHLVEIKQLMSLYKTYPSQLNTK